MSEAEPFVDEILAKWTSRFIANGIDYNDLEWLKGEITGWSDYIHPFVQRGDRYLHLAREAEERGNRETAAEHQLRASSLFHFGSHVWHVDDGLSRSVHARAVDTFGRAGENRDPPVTRIEVDPPGGHPVYAYMHVPDRPSGGPTPLVVLLPGLDSIKEELWAYARPLHERGIATIAIDGPGQGETWHHRAMTPEYPAVIGWVIDHLEGQDDRRIDPDRLGVYGISLGGFYAPFVAANDDRFAACVGVSGPFTVGPVSEWDSPLLRDQFRWACQSDEMAHIDEITTAMTLEGCIDDLTAPTLILTGSADAIIDPAETKRIADAAPEGEFILYEGAGHVCNDVPTLYRTHVADWLRATLTAGER